MITHTLAFLAGVVFGAVVPPLLVWALFRDDRRRAATLDREPPRA